MMNLTKCHWVLYHYYLSSLIICIALIGFSSPAMAYTVTTLDTDQRFSVAEMLTWDKQNGYRVLDLGWSGGIIPGMLQIDPDAGDPPNVTLQVEISISDLRLGGDIVDFYNFVHPLNFSFGPPFYGYDAQYITEVIVGGPAHIVYLAEAFFGVSIDPPYPAVIDESDPLGAYATVRATQHVVWSAKIIGPVPEPTTILLLSLGLLGLLGLRRRFKKQI